jgi:site-specific DNA-methyltransferase (adenine-specific)
LKPAHEPIVLARKPLAGTVAGNVLAHGTGALNVDGCRIGNGGQLKWSQPRDMGYHGGTDSEADPTANPAGRWPANVCLDPEAAAMLDEQTGEMRARGNVTPTRSGTGMFYGEASEQPTNGGDSGGASRFLYVAKASSAERNAGLDGFEEREGYRTTGAGLATVRRCREHDRALPSGANVYECGCAVEYSGESERRATRNVHPTVKPIELMRWLVRLVTPPNGVVLDPFTGSGTTGCAAVLEGFRFVGIEREPEYAAIARARIAWWSEHPDGMKLVERLEAERAHAAKRDAGQIGLF